jgi:hypothetical protein
MSEEGQAVNSGLPFTLPRHFAADLKLHPKVTSVLLAQANEALEAVNSDAIDQAAAIVP